MPICHHFARGFCSRGAECSFSHSPAAILPPGDWFCPGCGDAQFSRNVHCRKCGSAKPAETQQQQLQNVQNASSFAPVRQTGAVLSSPYSRPGASQEVTKEEVEQFLRLNPVEIKAQEQLRNMDPQGQRIVINRGDMTGARDPTAALIGRMVTVERHLKGGVQTPVGDWICPGCSDTQFGRNTECRRCGTPKPASAVIPGPVTSCKFCQAGHCWNHMTESQQAHAGAVQSPLQETMPATPEDVEQFLILNLVEPHAQRKFREMEPKVQRLVINKGSLAGARDATAAFIGRMASIEKIAKGDFVLPPGDWICVACGDHQFMRNDSCRKCGAAKPTCGSQQGFMNTMQAVQKAEEKKSEWACSACGFLELPDHDQCTICGHARGAAPPANAPKAGKAAKAPKAGKRR